VDAPRTQREDDVSERLEWRRLYQSRETLFLDGVGVGDYYLASDGVYRVRAWPEDRLQGGRERLVLSEEAARQMLVRMIERLQRERGE
jgi:hypothetical protein